MLVSLTLSVNASTASRMRSAASSAAVGEVRGNSARNSFATPARQQVACAHVLGHDLRRGLQHLVAYGVPVRVVHLFEVVDIAQQQGHGLLGTLARCQRVLGLALEMAAGCTGRSGRPASPS